MSWADELTLNAVTNGTPEDNSFATATPSASLTMIITNPELLGKFKPNEKFYVDFTPAN